jgi:peptide/nickel transport system permease protein
MLVLLAGALSGLTWPLVGLHAEGHERFTLFEYLADTARHLLLPVVCLTYGGLAYLSRHVRSGMLEVLRQDYVRTARAKGLPERQVIWRHALRNALIPVITLLGSLLPALLGGSVIVESIFSIPGLGLLSFEAIGGRDYPVVMAITLLVAVLTMLGILLSDLLTCWVDPRVALD